MVGKNNSVRKIVNDGLLKTLVRALPCGIVWMDKPNPFVVSGVAYGVHTCHILQILYHNNSFSFILFLLHYQVDCRHQFSKINLDISNTFV